MTGGDCDRERERDISDSSRACNISFTDGIQARSSARPRGCTATPATARIAGRFGVGMAAAEVVEDVVVIWAHFERQVGEAGFLIAEQVQDREQEQELDLRVLSRLTVLRLFAPEAVIYS